MLSFILAGVASAVSGLIVGHFLLRGPRRELARLQAEREALDREFEELNRTFHEVCDEVFGDPSDVDGDDRDDAIEDDHDSLIVATGTL